MLAPTDIASPPSRLPYGTETDPIELEKQFIRKAASRSNGNPFITVDILDITFTNLLKRMENLGLKYSDFFDGDFLFPDNVGMPGVRR